MQEILQLIYTSVLSPATPISEVSSIIRSSRNKNFSYCITGVLLFDGQHFCQYIEGEASHVNALTENIRKDSRNVNFKVICSHPAQGMRKFSNWRAGYPMECSPDVILKIMATPRDCLLVDFLQMTRSFDLV